MRQRFLNWTVLTLILLLGSALVGAIVTAAIRPQAPNYNRLFPTAVANPALNPRYDIVNRSETRFHAPTVVTTPESGQPFQKLLQQISKQFDGGMGAEILASHFDLKLTSEEEYGLGRYRMTNTIPTEGDLQVFVSLAKAELLRWAKRKPVVLTATDVQVLNIAHSMNGQDVRVLARHTRPAANPKTGPMVAYVRWWFRKDPQNTSHWRVYDLEYPTTRLRFAAVLRYLPDSQLPQPLDPNTGAMVGVSANTTVLGLMSAIEAWPRVQKLGDEADQTVTKGLATYTDLSTQVYFDAARWVVTARQALLNLNRPHASQLLGWVEANAPETPKVRLGRVAWYRHLEQYNQAIESLAEYRRQMGNDADAVVEEVLTLLAQGQSDAAQKALQAGRTEFPHEPALNRSDLVPVTKK